MYMINMTSMKRKGAIHDVPAEAKVLAIYNVYVQHVVVEASLGNVVDANAHVRAKTPTILLRMLLLIALLRSMFMMFSKMRTFPL